MSKISCESDTSICMLNVDPLSELKELGEVVISSLGGPTSSNTNFQPLIQVAKEIEEKNFLLLLGISFDKKEQTATETLNHDFYCPLEFFLYLPSITVCYFYCILVYPCNY